MTYANDEIAAFERRDAVVEETTPLHAEINRLRACISELEQTVLRREDELERAEGRLSMLLEICICSAVLLPDGRIIRGHRHGDAIRTARELIDYRHSIGLDPGPYESIRGEVDQGFVTSANRYVGREEGLALQLAAGIESACPSGYRNGHLFSEDLY